MNYVYDATSENFSTVVLENSHRVPVVVDFWAPWCGPCQALMPLLTRLADVYGGQFILAKVNIDEEQDLATQFAVRSVPTVKMFRHGKLVGEFLGALPESQIRAFLDQHVERESDRTLAAARELFAQGQVDQAVETATTAMEAEPENQRIQIGLLEMLMEAGRHEAAAKVIESMPVSIRMEPQVAAVAARLAFAAVAAGAPSVETLEQRIASDPADSEARYQLSAHRVITGDYEAALEQLLELVRRDRKYGNDAGREGLLKVFEMLGGEGELVNKFRRLMFNALH